MVWKESSRKFREAKAGYRVIHHQIAQHIKSTWRKWQNQNLKAARLDENARESVSTILHAKKLKLKEKVGHKSILKASKSQSQTNVSFFPLCTNLLF